MKNYDSEQERESNNYKDNNYNDKINIGYWNEIEQIKFKEALYIFGRNWIEIQNYIKTRSLEQIKSHSQKYFKNLYKKYCKEYEKKISLNKSPNSSLKFNKLEFIYQWIENLIKFSYLPLIDHLEIKIKNPKENYDCLFKILQKRAFKLNFSKSKEIKCCGCTYGKRICNCNNDCCGNNTSITIDDLKINSSTKEIKEPIFKIEKLQRENKNEILSNYIWDNIPTQYFELNKSDDIFNLFDKKIEYDNITNEHFFDNKDDNLFFSSS